jgi:D-alanyl-D-alanine carboxypeptidase/D-alanyl-D-alanine-endopeptidase (penicillin-binding protein 4)
MMNRHTKRRMAAMASFGVLMLPAQTLAQERAVSAPAASLTDRVRAVLEQPALTGTSWGIVVEDETGREIVSIAPTGRFVPASNTKIFATTAAFEQIARGTFKNQGTEIRLEGKPRRPDIVLVGKGDAMLQDTPDCKTDCLVQLADAVVAAKLRSVGAIIGDDTLFPDERFVAARQLRPSRTVTSALTINDNMATITIKPAAEAGQRPAVTSADLEPEYRIENQLVTGAAGSETSIQVEAVPNTRTLRLFGSVPAGAAIEHKLPIEDPADFAAMRLKRLLEQRGVRVTGGFRARHRPMQAGDLAMGAYAAADTAKPLAALTPPPIIEDLTVTSKISQNLHSGLLTKKTALALGASGSTPNGIEAMNLMLDRAGVPRSSYTFYDGWGSSADNRVTPRWVVHFLKWTQRQSWGAEWKGTLPVAGVDGTLSERFKGTLLQGRLFAKTGTIQGVNGLGGFMTSKSGKQLVFSVYANDRPITVPTATGAMDAALVMIAETN